MFSCSKSYGKFLSISLKSLDGPSVEGIVEWGFVSRIGKEMGLHDAVARLPIHCAPCRVSLAHVYRTHIYGKPSYRYIIYNKTYKNISC